MPFSLAQLNEMDQQAFVSTLGFVFEDTPTIAAQTWHQRPFIDGSDLHQKMVAIVQALNQDEKLALIRAHPDLGSKFKMADASVREQASAGLDQLTPAEYEQFRSLNQAYKSKFGFPFIIAVKAQTKNSIFEAFETRLHHDAETEMQQALTEIARIAWFRLTDLLHAQ